VAIVAQHFSTKRALVMGIVVSGGSLGAIIYPIVLNNLIHGRVGFANGVRVSAGLLAACLLLAGVTMRPRYPKRIGAGSIKRRSIVQSMKLFAHDRIYLIANLA
jgi:MFS family permease